MKPATTTGVTVLLIGLAFLALIWIFQRRMMYFPFGSVPSPRAVGVPRAEEVELRTQDGLVLGAWFVPAENGPARAIVLVFNGNAGNRSYRASLAAALARARLSVLLFDYRGYGGNPGSPTEAGFLSDARAALSYLQKRAGTDHAPIVYFGESLGTAVAVALAVEQHPAGLILRSPFTSMVDVGRHHYPLLPVSALLWDRHEVMGRIARVHCPVLIIAGDSDRVIPLELTLRVHQAAVDPKRLVVIAGADHNDEVLFTGDRLISEVVQFVGTLGAISADASEPRTNG